MKEITVYPIRGQEGGYLDKVALCLDGQVLELTLSDIGRVEQALKAGKGFIEEARRLEFLKKNLSLFS